MSRVLRRVARWLRIALAGRKLNTSLDRHRKAADALDKAVREVLAR